MVVSRVEAASEDGTRAVRTPEEVGTLSLGDLSDYFNPFLEHFMKEALRCGGEVRVALTDRAVDGIYLFHEVEKEASIFTRDRALAESLFRRREGVAVFSEFELGPVAEGYRVYAADPNFPQSGHRFAHPVRTARRDEMDAVAALMNEVCGQVDERWLSSIPASGDACFVVQGSGELAGVGWVSVVNDHGRLHSLAVRPRYRRTGVGRDILHARLGWVAQAGATRVISEIAERNEASCALAESGGMRPIGQIWRSHRP